MTARLLMQPAPRPVRRRVPREQPLAVEEVDAPVDDPQARAFAVDFIRGLLARAGKR